MMRQATADKARLAAILASIFIAAALALPALAQAEVNRSDYVMGVSIEERGISPALCPSIDAPRAICMGEDGTVYYQRHSTQEAKIASVTKIMTAVVAVDSMPLDTVITVSSVAASVGESSAQLQEYDTLTLAEALKALLWPSGNDAAVAIAETIGRQTTGNDSSTNDAVSVFVSAMNAKARELGMENTVFTNPHGLDGESFGEDMHSTARDIVKLVAYAMQHDTIRSITSVPGGICQVTRDGELIELQLESTDALLGVAEGAIGVKTGFTDEAGYCFAGAVEREGFKVYTVVLGCGTEEERFEDTQTLWDWAYRHRVSVPLINAADGRTGAPVVAQVACRAWDNATVAATVEDPDATLEVFDIAGNITQEATYIEPEGAVHAGDALGTLTFYQHNEVVAELPLVAAESLDAPSFTEGVSIWWKRLIGNFTGEKNYADSYLVNTLPTIYNKTQNAA